ncbi:MAG: zinc ABC transporter substrate-binding protein [Proteobacteria bacterium]|nr:zinc ABC transporter substrate-binding protein [Pseudomonadota bacterium]
MPASISAEVKIATTIRPLKLIAEAIVQDMGLVTSIVEARQSPHHYTMSPSDRVALDQADLLIWIGPKFETYLADFFQHAKNAKEVITAIEMPDLIIYNISSDQIDSHLWLDSRNALLIAQQITQIVIRLDDSNAANYRDNLNKFRSEIDRANIDITAAFSDSTRNSYAVYHDAYQYFEIQFGLSHQFVLLRNPEVEPGIQEILLARKRLREQAPQCLLREYGSNAALIETMLADHELKTITVDLLGFEVTSPTQGYIELMEKVTLSFTNCLYRIDN